MTDPATDLALEVLSSYTSWRSIIFEIEKHKSLIEFFGFDYIIIKYDI